jgi:hypothetical protein
MTVALASLAVDLTADTSGYVAAMSAKTAADTKATESAAALADAQTRLAIVTDRATSSGSAGG